MSDYSVISVGIQYSGVRFECKNDTGLCFDREYVDWEHRKITSKNQLRAEYVQFECNFYTWKPLVLSTS